MYASRYLSTAVQRERARTTHELTAWGISQPHAVKYYFHSGSSPTANLPSLKLRLALSGSGSRNDPFTCLYHATLASCLSLAVLCCPALPLLALLVVALAASESCYLLACPL